MLLETRRTKVVATMGPSSLNEDILTKLIESGLNVARVNFSHGDDENHINAINLVNKVSEKLNKFVGVLADLKGPKIRVGKFLNGSEEYKENEIIDIIEGDIIGTHEKFSINQKELFDDVKVGNKLLVDDGKVVLEIVEKEESHLKVKVLNNGVISDRKGINAPGVVLTMPFVSDKDYHDLLIAIKYQVNAIASSFVRRKEDVLAIRKILDENGGKDIEIIAKIENQEGVDNIEEIIKVANGIMVARGDMGVELPLEMVPVYQKRIIKLCNKYGKPVITATHMLESMIHCPRPTRAEAGDVANAVLDGTDAVMLSGESAVGEYPVEAIKTMVSIIEEIETIIDFNTKFTSSLLKFEKHGINDAIGVSVASFALNINNAKAIFAFTDTGGTAKRISHFRPALPIIACTTSLRAAKRLSYYWGVSAVITEGVERFTDFDIIARRESEKLGLSKGDVIIMTSGYGVDHGETNTIRLITL